MFQPFEIFKPEYINRLISLNKRYLVSQGYKKAFDHFAEKKIDVLFSDYDDMGLAKIHLKAIINDKYASIIDLTNVIHREKVHSMLTDDSPYRIYWAVVKSADEIKKRVDFKYTGNIRRYITKNTSWRIGADEKIRPSLQLIFGEMFIILKRGNQILRVKFDEIEKA